MATIIDNGPGDVNHFGQVLNDIGNNWVQNNFKHKQLEQEQQQINNQYEIAKGQLRNQNADMAMKQQAWNQANATTDAQNALLFAKNKNPSSLPQLSATDLSPLSVPSRDAITSPSLDMNQGVSDASSEFPMDTSPSTESHILPDSTQAAVAPSVTPPQTGSANNGSMLDVRTDTPWINITGQSGNIPSDATALEKLKHYGGNAVNTAYSLATGVPRLMGGLTKIGSEALANQLFSRPNAMTAEEVQKAQATKKSLDQKLNPSIVAPPTNATPALESPSPDQFVSPGNEPPPPPAPPAPPGEGSFNPQITVPEIFSSSNPPPSDSVSKVAEVLDSPKVTPAKLMSLAGNAETSSVLMSMLTPPQASKLEEMSKDPRFAHVNLQDVAINSLKTQLMPLQQMAEASDLQTKIYTNQFSLNMYRNMLQNPTGSSGADTSWARNQDGSPNYSAIETHSSQLQNFMKMTPDAARVRAYSDAGIKVLPQEVESRAKQVYEDFNKDEVVQDAQSALTQLNTIRQGLSSSNPTGISDNQILQAFAKLHNKAGVSVTEGNLKELLSGIPVIAKADVGYWLKRGATGAVIPQSYRSIILKNAEDTISAKVNNVVENKLKPAMDTLEQKGAPRDYNAIGFPFRNYKDSSLKPPTSSVKGPSSNAGMGKTVIQNGNVFRDTGNGYQYVGPDRK